MHEQLEQDRIHAAADVLILTIESGEIRLLLSRRTHFPYQGRWALPGKLIGLDESAETAARSLLEEMLPGQDAFLEQLYTFSDLNRDPRGRVISVSYLAILPWRTLETLLPGAEALTCFSAQRDESGLRLWDGSGASLISSDLAFDHGRIIETGLMRLAGKIDYTDIGFQFLNDQNSFSLSELQSVFEAVLNRPIDDSNFRRTILKRYLATGRLRQTDQYGRRKRGRPAALYCLNHHDRRG